MLSVTGGRKAVLDSSNADELLGESSDLLAAVRTFVVARRQWLCDDTDDDPHKEAIPGMQIERYRETSENLSLELWAATPSSLCTRGDDAFDSKTVLDMRNAVKYDECTRRVHGKLWHLREAVRTNRAAILNQMVARGDSALKRVRSALRKLQEQRVTPTDATGELGKFRLAVADLADRVATLPLNDFNMAGGRVGTEDEEELVSEFFGTATMEKLEAAFQGELQNCEKIVQDAAVDAFGDSVQKIKHLVAEGVQHLTNEAVAHAVRTNDKRPIIVEDDFNIFVDEQDIRRIRLQYRKAVDSREKEAVVFRLAESKSKDVFVHRKREAVDRVGQTQLAIQQLQQLVGTGGGGCYDATKMQSVLRYHHSEYQRLTRQIEMQLHHLDDIRAKLRRAHLTEARVAVLATGKERSKYIDDAMRRLQHNLSTRDELLQAVDDHVDYLNAEYLRCQQQSFAGRAPDKRIQDLDGSFAPGINEGPLLVISEINMAGMISCLTKLLHDREASSQDPFVVTKLRFLTIATELNASIETENRREFRHQAHGSTGTQKPGKKSVELAKVHGGSLTHSLSKDMSLSRDWGGATGEVDAPTSDTRDDKDITANSSFKYLDGETMKKADQKEEAIQLEEAQHDTTIKHSQYTRRAIVKNIGEHIRYLRCYADFLRLQMDETPIRKPVSDIRRVDAGTHGLIRTYIKNPNHLHIGSHRRATHFDTLESGGPEDDALLFKTQQMIRQIEHSQIQHAHRRQTSHRQTEHQAEAILSHKGGRQKHNHLDWKTIMSDYLAEKKNEAKEIAVLAAKTTSVQAVDVEIKQMKTLLQLVFNDIFRDHRAATVDFGDVPGHQPTSHSDMVKSKHYQEAQLYGFIREEFERVSSLNRQSQATAPSFMLWCNDNARFVNNLKLTARYDFVRVVMIGSLPAVSQMVSFAKTDKSQQSFQRALTVVQSPQNGGHASVSGASKMGAGTRNKSRRQRPSAWCCSSPPADDVVCSDDGDNELQLHENHDAKSFQQEHTEKIGIIFYDQVIKRVGEKLQDLKNELLEGDDEHYGCDPFGPRLSRRQAIVGAMTLYVTQIIAPVYAGGHVEMRLHILKELVRVIEITDPGDLKADPFDDIILEQVNIDSLMEQMRRQLKRKESACAVHDSFVRLKLSIQGKVHGVQLATQDLEVKLKQGAILQERRRRICSAANLGHDFVCPITLKEIKEPMMCVDGFNYDRSAIQKWFLDCQQSPMTNDDLSNFENKFCRNADLCKVLKECAKIDAACRENDEAMATISQKIVQDIDVLEHAHMEIKNELEGQQYRRWRTKRRNKLRVGKRAAAADETRPYQDSDGKSFSESTHDSGVQFGQSSDGDSTELRRRAVQMDEDISSAVLVHAAERMDSRSSKKTPTKALSSASEDELLFSRFQGSSGSSQKMVSLWLAANESEATVNRCVSDYTIHFTPLQTDAVRTWLACSSGAEYDEEDPMLQAEMLDQLPEIPADAASLQRLHESVGGPLRIIDQGASLGRRGTTSDPYSSSRSQGTEVDSEMARIVRNLDGGDVSSVSSSIASTMTEELRKAAARRDLHHVVQRTEEDLDAMDRVAALDAHNDSSVNTDKLDERLAGMVGKLDTASHASSAIDTPAPEGRGTCPDMMVRRTLKAADLDGTSSVNTDTLEQQGKQMDMIDSRAAALDIYARADALDATEVASDNSSRVSFINSTGSRQAAVNTLDADNVFGEASSFNSSSIGAQVDALDAANNDDGCAINRSNFGAWLGALDAASDGGASADTDTLMVRMTTLDVAEAADASGDELACEWCRQIRRKRDLARHQAMCPQNPGIRLALSARGRPPVQLDLKSDRTATTATSNLSMSSTSSAALGGIAGSLDLDGISPRTRGLLEGAATLGQHELRALSDRGSEQSFRRAAVVCCCTSAKRVRWLCTRIRVELPPPPPAPSKRDIRAV
jgi:hypothetical protein